MSPPFYPSRPSRPAIRVFHPTRLAPAALAQAYELLLPEHRRPLTAPRATAAPRPERRRAAGN
jgi:hypothetical protein